MALTKNFSISEALKFGFNTLTANFGFFLKINLAFIALYVGMYLIYISALFLQGNFYAASTSFYRSDFNPVAPITGAFLALMTSYGVLSYVLKEYYVFALTRPGLALYDGKPVSAQSVWDPKNFFNFFSARCLFSIKCFLGFLLLVIPGIYIFCKYYFTGFPLIDEKTNSIGQDKDIAERITNGVRWKILAFHLINVFLFTLAVVTVIGALLAPMFILSSVYVYRTLERETTPAPKTCC